MAGTAHTHVQMAARVMWKPNFAGEGAFRPFQSRPLLRSAACLTKAASGDLQLVKREETNDGAILFVFGDEAAVEAQKKEEESAAPPAPAAEEEKPAMQEEPVQEPVPEPEVSYEAARAEQVAESAAEAGPAAEEEQEEQHHVQAADEGPVNGALVPDFADPEMDPDEALSDEDAPDLQDEIAKTLTSLRVADLKAMCKERGISGYSKFRKSQLVRVLKEAMLVESE